MRTHPFLPFRQSGPRRPTRRSGLAALCFRLLRGVRALGLLLALTGMPLLLQSSLLAAGAVAGAREGSVYVIPVNGAIGPASADFIVRGLARAAQNHAQLAVIEIDTPGGLDTSMRQIIKAILSSPVPVASFIAPGGARAASAGTYIVYASHIAAMAPGTNLGAATPIQIGLGGAAPQQPQQPEMPLSPPASSGNKASDAGKTDASASAASAPAALDAQSTEIRKQVHDAAAYIRGLAQLRGRNQEWAEHAVREAVSLSAREALDQHVVDLIARDVPDLLRQVDGHTVNTIAGDQRLATASARIVTLEQDWRSHFLAVITDPNVALLLLMIGMYGLFFEFANPGFVLPGVAGAISLLLGLFAMQMLPINYVGLTLVFLGIAFLIAEAFLPTFGTLGFGGIVAFAIGALMLIDTDVPGYGIPFPLIAALTLFSAIFIFAVSSVALRARRRPVVTGSEAMIGSIGVVLDDGLLPGSDAGAADGVGVGWARVHGERWRVTGPGPLAAGREVRVTGRRGLMLTVEPV
ncbi:MAG: nodulation protein NfeD [Paraburkholderia sp.]|nr:nodulation protein NfeD [Paraburkholderia sp.]